MTQFQNGRTLRDENLSSNEVEVPSIKSWRVLVLLILAAMTAAFLLGIAVCYVFMIGFARPEAKAIEKPPEPIRAKIIPMDDNPPPDQFMIGLETMKLVVDYDLPWNEALAQGNYDQVSLAADQIPFNRDKKGKHEIACKLFNYLGGKTKEELVGQLKKEGYRPADIKELLAFGAAKQDLSQNFYIVALGSGWGDPLTGHKFPAIDRWSNFGSKRRLSAEGFVLALPGLHRLLGVKE